jgi:hypothetical protein
MIWLNMIGEVQIPSLMCLALTIFLQAHAQRLDYNFQTNNLCEYVRINVCINAIPLLPLVFNMSKQTFFVLGHRPPTLSSPRLRF